MRLNVKEVLPPNTCCFGKGHVEDEDIGCDHFMGSNTNFAFVHLRWKSNLILLMLVQSVVAVLCSSGDLDMVHFLLIARLLIHFSSVINISLDTSPLAISKTFFIQYLMWNKHFFLVLMLAFLFILSIRRSPLYRKQLGRERETW